MRIFKYPQREEWPSILARPCVENSGVAASVKRIIEEVRAGADRSLIALTERFDGVRLTRIRVSPEEFDRARSSVPEPLKQAIQRAADNIRRFHARTRGERTLIETSPGVVCWKKQVPIERVGLYVPAGSAPLFSTVLMLAIPAVEAGCSRIVIATPPDRNGDVDAAVLFAADLCGVREIYKVGGAQAIASLAFGTETVPKVDKIFGPGNRHVTEAKLQVMRYGTGIDMPAGPSEVAVLADASCVPQFVAADLLAQAEHGPDSQVVLISPSEKVVSEVIATLPGQAAALSRRAMAEASLANSAAILVPDLAAGVEMVNEYAPEHLIIATNEAEEVAEQITNAGSVFIGNFACESAGDYASGTNHTLPTGGAARACSGLSTDSFLKTITFQRISREGLADLGPVIEAMADGEHLDAHRNAVSIRLAEGRRPNV